MDKDNGFLQSISIRRLKMTDYEAVLKWSKDDAFCSANGWKSNRNPDELYRWWLDCVNHAEADFIRMGIVLNEQLIGYADLACVKDQTAELGIVIGESELWGKGIGYYSALRIIEYAATNLAIATMTAETHEANIRSRRMLEKLGFTEVSRIGSEQYLGVSSQLIQYSLNCVPSDI